MILANLTKAIREQNYYAVVLEFLIVIAGVVIGFQITAWNESRAEQASAKQAIENLKQEFTVIVHEATFRTDFHLERISQLQQYITCLELDCEQEVLDFLVPAVASTGINFFTVPPNSSTYAELVSSGEVDLIASDDLRFALFRFASNLDASSKAIGRINDLMIGLDQSIKQRTRLDVTSFAQPDAQNWNRANDDYTIHNVLPVIELYDWDAMRADPLVRSSAEEMLRMQNFYAGNHASLLEDARSVIQLLEAES